MGQESAAPHCGRVRLPVRRIEVDDDRRDVCRIVVWQAEWADPGPSSARRRSRELELSRPSSGRERTGIRPLGLPDNNPTYVAAIIVNEDVANWQTSAAAQWVADFSFDRHAPWPPPALAGYNVYQGTVKGKDNGLGGVNLNGANNFGVFILTTLNSSAPSLTGSLDTICGQTPLPARQLECFAYDDGGEELSFIHSYSDARLPRPPRTRSFARRRSSAGGDGSGNDRRFATVLQSEWRLRGDDGRKGRLLRRHGPQQRPDG